MMKSSILAYLKDEEGQTTLEYALILAIVVAVIVQMKGQMTDKVKILMDKVFGEMFNKILP